mmetsp:Transcript_5502/g.5930  ORF Transcript_5502/g.5930 Transcript_5502/m.5930 type:complete len:120 (-) Transcript_5502:196-555(-)|eukprot:CAMPEP_0176434482 /NCGR_PEP_ID=MMETSP0127-20121128/16705_1 /TAXON_ID=938130 /ORGANISM="Platyophrya macrostoma, Strain WH" /LENGTH=119 /DNA_ID=CAMNT_0017817231 /DNA_START=159 /DNA_END=518 /DNA_ORIENTATION=-
MEAQKSQKLIKPENNRVQISSKKDTGFYVFIGKLFLLDFADIELHGLGDAITTTVKVAEALSRYGYTDIKKIQTTTLTPDADSKGPRGKKAKLIVTLSRSKKFPELIKTFKIDGNAPKK